MPLNIKNREADQLARELARETGGTITEAVILALRESLRRTKGRKSMPSLKEDLEAISARCAALPDRDARSPEEILDFDEHGLPR